MDPDGVRDSRYKLIYFDKLEQWEFYDLQKDLCEMKNAYRNSSYQQIINKLKAEMQRLRKELKDEDQFADKLPKDDVG